MASRAIFTHNDLDGLTSAMLARLAQPDADVYFCDYSGLPDLVRARLDRYDEMWFTDLSIRDQAMFEALHEAGVEVWWFDHHASSLPQGWMVECRIDLSGEKCAADVVADWLAEHGIDLPIPLQTLLDWTHDQDLWLRRLPESQAFNDILGHMSVQELFDLLNQDLGRVYQWTEGMHQAARLTQEARQYSLELAQATSVVGPLANGHRIRAACCWGSVSEVGDSLGDDDTLVVLLDLRAFERGRPKYSFRTQSDDIAANRIAERLGGGGHPKASGAPADLEILRVLAGEVLERVVRAADET